MFAEEITKTCKINNKVISLAIKAQELEKNTAFLSSTNFNNSLNII